jgi:hypothetical protein
MSNEENKAIVRRFYKEILEEGNLDLANQLFAPGWVLHDDREVGFWTLDEESSSGPGAVKEGPAAVKELVGRIRNFLSNLRVLVEDQMAAESDRVVTRFAVSGTAQSATAQSTQVDVKGISISQFSGGKIAGSWLNWESGLMYEQLGHLPQEKRPLWW